MNQTIRRLFYRFLAALREPIRVVPTRENRGGDSHRASMANQAKGNGGKSRFLGGTVLNLPKTFHPAPSGRMLQGESGPSRCKNTDPSLTNNVEDTHDAGCSDSSNPAGTNQRNSCASTSKGRTA